jgi:hypothetical protein
MRTMRSSPLSPTITVHQQSDGSFVAMGRELPLFVVAPSLDELWNRLVMLRPSIDRLIELLAEDGPDDENLA